jgi:hypothetical protein
METPSLPRFPEEAGAVLSIQVRERSLLPAENYALRLGLIAGPRNSSPAIGMLYSQGGPKLPNREWERESPFYFHGGNTDSGLPTRDPEAVS